MSRDRRRTRTETRLEALEGRITPSGMWAHPVIGPQILEKAPLALDGMEKHRFREIHGFGAIDTSLKRELYLRHHPRLEFKLAKLEASSSSFPVRPLGQAAGLAPPTPPIAVDPTGMGGLGGPNGGSAPIPVLGPPPVQTTIPMSGSTEAIRPIGSNPPVYIPPAANLDATLNQIYLDRSDSSATLESLFAGRAVFSGSSVEVEVHGNGADFSTLLGEVTGLDPSVRVVDSSSTYRSIDAYVPIADLVTLANSQGVGGIGADAPPNLN